MDPVWGEWTEWVWDDNQARYWRARRDAQGNIEYAFHYPNAHAQAAPRGDVGNITDTLSNFTLGDDHGAYTDQNAYTTVAGDAGGSTMYSASTAHSAQIHASASHLAKGKSRAVNPQNPQKPKSRNQKDPAKDNLGKQSSKKPRKPAAKNEVEDPALGQPPFYTKTGAVSPSDYVSGASSAAFQHQPYSDSAYGSSPHDPSYASGFSQSPGGGQFFDQDSTVHSIAEDQTDDPERYSLHGQAPDPETGYSRSSGSEDPPAEVDQQSSYYCTTPQDSRAQDALSAQVHDPLSLADGYATGAPTASYSGGESSSMATAHSYPYSAYANDGGRETPRPFHQQAATATTAEDYASQTNMSEGRDFGQEYSGQEGYVVEHSSRFRPGSIFKILWCEPLGAGPPKSEAPTHHIEVRRDGRTFYQGYRRFIVVANDEGHCTCVPILTYERQACNKRGVKPGKHGIIYQAGKTPRTLPGEPRLGFDPVRAQLSERTEQLVKESRVNYAKLTTVEHNFPVHFIGKVHPEDFKHIVVPAVDYCWEKKNRHNY